MTTVSFMSGIRFVSIVPAISVTNVSDYFTCSVFNLDTGQYIYTTDTGAKIGSVDYDSHHKASFYYYSDTFHTGGTAMNLVSEPNLYLTFNDAYELDVTQLEGQGDEDFFDSATFMSYLVDSKEDEQDLSIHFEARIGDYCGMYDYDCSQYVAHSFCDQSSQSCQCEKGYFASVDHKSCRILWLDCPEEKRQGVWEVYDSSDRDVATQHGKMNVFFYVTGRLPYATCYIQYYIINLISGEHLF